MVVLIYCKDVYEVFNTHYVNFKVNTLGEGNAKDREKITVRWYKIQKKNEWLRK